jgi:hypothetical protein
LRRAFRRRFGGVGCAVQEVTISRADLAACMLASLTDPATGHRHVAIAS